MKKLLTELNLPGANAFNAVSVPVADFAKVSERIVEHGIPLVLMYATDERKKSSVFVIHAVFQIEGELLTIESDVSPENPSYPSLTRSIMAAHWYERQIMDQFGIEAVGHPDPRRLMHHENIPEGTYPMRKDFEWDTKLAHANVPYPMHQVEGEGVYEIPVGPIHAGIIEPGHFRFNVRGERIITLEGKLFFKHKGVLKLVEGKTPEEALPFVERVSGDMVVGHTLAFVQAVEKVSGVKVSERAEYLRVIWSELERACAHIFDMGNMGGMGTGFTFMAAQGFRMVEEMRRLNQSLVGHRFLRGAIVLGGAHDITAEMEEKIQTTLKRIEKDMREVLEIAYAKDGLKERFETTGILSREAALAYGAQGIAARSSGVDIDLRRDMPYAAYDELDVAVMPEKAGDVLARFTLRARELTESFRLIRLALMKLPLGDAKVSVPHGTGDAYGFAESWRGAVMDFVRLDSKGRIDRLVIRDPSFCNWALFGELAPGNIVPDFPLCNKSLNLSYSGTDL
ncbi:MAG: NADH-quinone oxidoreductase subunit C [Patescibacteria group bacterium]